MTKQNRIHKLITHNEEYSKEFDKSFLRRNTHYRNPIPKFRKRQIFKCSKQRREMINSKIY